MPPKLPPVDELVIQRQIAAYLDLDVRQINNLVKEGMPTVLKNGRRMYSVRACVKWYWGRKLESQAPKVKQDKGDLLNRKLEAEAGLAELSLEQKRASLVPVEYLDSQVSAVLLQMRSALRNMPGVFAPRLVGLKAVTDAQLVLQAIVDEMLATLSQSGDADELDEEPGAPLELV